MYNVSAFAVNAFIRSESAVQVAAMFPLFRVTVQILTNVSRHNSSFFQYTDNVGFLIVWACTLIGCIALLFLPSPFLILQIWYARIRWSRNFAACIVSGFIFILLTYMLDSWPVFFWKQDLQIGADIENEKKKGVHQTLRVELDDINGFPTIKHHIARP